MGSDLTTPMMRQWSALKAQAGRSLLFFRLGDFYELFDTDAEIAAPILGVVLTSRNQKSPDAVSLCGIPVHQFENYIGKLLDRGYSVALAEQTEAPSPGKALVRREIVQWFTPGIRLLANDERQHFCAVVSGSAESWNVAAADVATGQVVVKEGASLEELQEVLDRLPCEDLRTSSDAFESIRSLYRESAQLLPQDEAEALILSGLKISDLSDSPASSRSSRIALGTLLKILKDAHPQEALRFFALPQLRDTVTLSAATRRNLNLFEPAGRSLFEFLDRTRTAFGRRELKRSLESPTQNVEELEHRQALIRWLKSESFIRRKLRERLKGVLDIHRLLRKRRGPKDLFKLSESLTQALEAIQLLSPQFALLESLQTLRHELAPLTETLSKSLQAIEGSDVGWIKPGVMPELDELRSLEQNSQALLSKLEEEMRNSLDISSLKIKFHQVLGYVFETTSAHREKLPTQLKRVQSLANADRFKTPELVDLEEKLLSVSGRIREAEAACVSKLYDQVEAHATKIIELTNQLGKLDVFQALAEVSVTEGWTTPVTVNDGSSQLQCLEARHPLIHPFVPLSFSMSADSLRVMLLTGPNMAGKSTLLRVAALLALLHQIGSDVPARSFKASVFDRIMCRMGASDDLATGQSTFFVEMREVAQMLHGATEKSLLVFDEIGRGTSTFDGMSLAWSIAEEVHSMNCLSLIATHYLELAELEKICPHLKSYHMGVEELDEKLIFTRELREGPASRSYGIHVARLAHLPEEILVRATQKLNQLERRKAPSLPLFEWSRHEST